MVFRGKRKEFSMSNFYEQIEHAAIAMAEGLFRPKRWMDLSALPPLPHLAVVFCLEQQ